MAYAISPNHLDSDFPSVWSLDDKIEIFTDRIVGWQINIAQQCADIIPHSGFAVLSIICSYFEMIAKFKDGYKNDNKSKGYFIKEFSLFLSRCPNIMPDFKDEVAKKVWKGVRCALYHTGITKGINLSGDFLNSIEYNDAQGKVNINPHRLVPDLSDHFGTYISELRNQNNKLLRNHFEARFDYQHN